MRTLQEFKATLFRALASPVRIRILEELRDGPVTVAELQRRLNLDSSNVSQHLAVLRAGGLVVGRREGNNVLYSAEEWQLYGLLDVARTIFENQVSAGRRLLETHDSSG